MAQKIVLLESLQHQFGPDSIYNRPYSYSCIPVLRPCDCRINLHHNQLIKLYNSTFACHILEWGNVGGGV